MDTRKGSSFSVLSRCAFVVLAYTCIAGVSSQEQGQPDLTGPNVCLKQEVTKSTQMVAVREATQIATKTWCLSIPPRCTTYRTVFKLVYKPQTQEKTDMVKRCCEGYILHSNGTCVALCANSCINGQCVAPNKCDCNAGFSGDTCTQKCPVAKWGPQCNNDCKCQNGAACDSVTGKCQCEDGWRGKQCEEACPAGFYGNLCLQQCRCLNGGLCDSVTGACKCGAGFCGPLCNAECDQRGGRICDQCQNGGRCLTEADDKCTCMSGWMGDVCASPCTEGYWGKNCSKPCKICYNHGKCDGVTGSCKCPAGYWGSQCEMQCEPGKYGPDCQTDCACENAQTCDPTSGKCHCHKGYKGDRCELRGCPDGLFGQFCNNTCHCSNMTTCHPIDGTCMCKNGWRSSGGPECSMCCILNDGGPDCMKDCGTTDRNYICGPELDGCVCLHDYQGPECRALGTLGSDSNNAALHSAANKSSNTGLIVGLCLAVIVVLLILALALFYRRRVRKLQNELASVTYNSSSSGTDADSETKSELHADNMLYLGGASSIGGKPTSVVMKNGETFVKVSEPLPKRPIQNTYVSMPNQNFDDRESIYQSIEYETPAPRHQYASIDETAATASPASGHTNMAFENQLYNQNGQTLFAPPSYQSVITETMSSTHPAEPVSK